MKKRTVQITILILLFLWANAINIVPIPMKALMEKNITSKMTETQYQVEVTHKDGHQESLSLDDYLIGVLAGEMPISFEDEALKAQCVASRTYVMSHDLHVDTTTNTQVYLTLDEMKQHWQEVFDQNYERLKKIVELTHNEVLTYQNEYISALFFSSSNGQTVSNEEYFTSASLPYLRQVESQWELAICPNIERDFTFSIDELSAIFNETISSMEILSYYDNGRVKEVRINDTIYSGREIREMLSLASTDFSIEFDQNQYTFHTIGYGHGVGMSQYGANGMALEGYDYQAILKHYYQGVEITKI